MEITPLSIAGAYYLILELSHPFAGLVSISSDMFDLSIRHLGADTRPAPSVVPPLARRAQALGDIRNARHLDDSTTATK